jgi:hypothetical protein
MIWKMVNAISILDALRCGRNGCDCLKALPGKGHVHCPAHKDTKPSFSVNEKNGTTLVHCQAGCAQDLVIAALEEKGLWPRATANKSNYRETRFQVRDIDDQLVAVHVRKDGPRGKKMWWEQPDGTNGLNGMPVSTLPLYGSEDLQQLPDGSPVVVTEGESSRDALRSMGIASVGTVTGAGDTPGNDALRPLIRLRPILWADNDEPGHPHMNRIAARLSALGCLTVGIVDWPEAPHKGDAADAVNLGVDVHQLIATSQKWEPGNIDLAALLDDVAAFVRRYVVLTNHQLRAIALWVAHTYAIDAADCTPYLLIQSAEKRSGKTLLLEVLSLLVARAWFTGRVTKAVLVRRIARLGPTLLLDETDATFSGNKEFSEGIRGVLNAGYRRGGVDSICVQVDGEWVDQDFPVFGPKALSGIGVLPDTVQDRGIPIEMLRKLKTEEAEKFRRKDVLPNATPLVDALITWADEAVPILEPAKPDIPDELGDRAADVWEPLLAIADMAGGGWPNHARQAALALSSTADQEDDSWGVTLLKDIQKVLTNRKVDRLPSVELASALAEFEESPWGDIRGKPLNASGLAKMLKSFNIKPKQIRIAGTTLKGYLRYDFIDAWERYTPEIGETPKHIDDFKPSEASGIVSPSDDSSETNALGETLNHAYVSSVSGVSASQGIQEAFDAQERDDRRWRKEL